MFSVLLLAVLLSRAERISSWPTNRSQEGRVSVSVLCQSDAEASSLWLVLLHLARGQQYWCMRFFGGRHGVIRRGKIQISQITLHTDIIVEKQHACMLHLGQLRQVKSKQVEGVGVLGIGIGHRLPKRPRSSTWVTGRPLLETGSQPHWCDSLLLQRHLGIQKGRYADAMAGRHPINGVV